jgi:hypothetical protein
VGQQVREEYKRLREFGVQIENELPLDGRFVNRAQQYAQAGRTTYENFQRRAMEARGHDEERSVRNAGDSCAGCLAAEARGWQPVGSLPLPGERNCLRNCKCAMEYRKSEEQVGTTDEFRGAEILATFNGPDSDLAGSPFRYGEWRGTPEDFIRDHARADVENLAAYDAEGNQLCHVIGTKNNVGLPKRHRESAEGGLIIHNHPNEGTSLSNADLSSAQSANVKEVKATFVLNGKAGVVTATRNGEEWGLPDRETLKQEFDDLLKASAGNFREQLKRAQVYGTDEDVDKLLRDAQFYYNHDAIQALSRKYGFRVRVEEIPSA